MTFVGSLRLSNAMILLRGRVSSITFILDSPFSDDILTASFVMPSRLSEEQSLKLSSAACLEPAIASSRRCRCAR